jgi:hypothetical protein
MPPVPPNFITLMDAPLDTPITSLPAFLPKLCCLPAEEVADVTLANLLGIFLWSWVANQTMDQCVAELRQFLKALGCCNIKLVARVIVDRATLAFPELTVATGTTSTNKKPVPLPVPSTFSPRRAANYPVDRLDNN